jgi:tryptophanase
MFVRLSDGREIPLESHKVRIVQKTALAPAAERLSAMREAGFNTFLLKSRDVFLDMLTDSGTNAMSDVQLAAMMVSDDAYAGSESFEKLVAAVRDVFGYSHVLPVHQGRAAEHLLARLFVKPGDAVPMNYHFTTTRAHFEMAGGEVLELFGPHALDTESDLPFKGNMDTARLEALVRERGAARVAFVRMEATTNLIGGQPFSLENLRAVRAIAAAHGIPVVLDASLISENAYLIRQREPAERSRSIAEIIREIMSLSDIMYLSGRKSCSVRGGLIATSDPAVYAKILPWLPVFEGFATYGGMSTKEIEAMAVGIREMTDSDVAGSSVELIRYLVGRLVARGVPALTPAGGLGCHVDAHKFLPHLGSGSYPAGALAAAIFLCSGVRSMERGTISMERAPDGREVPSDLELARLAVPRRVYTVSHMDYVADRLAWLHARRDLVGGLAFVEEPPVLRFFFGRLRAEGDWPERLVGEFRKEFGESV